MQKRVPEEAPSNVLYRKFCTHFFDVAKKAAPECVCLTNLYTRGPENPSEKSVFFLERGPGGKLLPAAWSLKINRFSKDFARKAVSIRRVAGTAQVLTLLIANAYKSPHTMEA